MNIKRLFLILIFLSFNCLLYSVELFTENFISSSVVIGDKTYPYYIVLENNQPTSIFIETIDWTDKIYGYGGPINLQIYYTFDGKIKKIKVLEHYETKTYASKILNENYLKQYYNKTSTDKFIIGKDIQAVTGATITANAINEIIFQATRNVNKYIFQKQIISVPSYSQKKELLKTFLFLIIYIITLALFLLNISQTIRIAVLILNVFFLGIIYSGGVSFSHILNIKNFFVNPLLNIFIITLIILTLITTLIFGRLYCGWFCPFGAVTEILFQIKRFFEKRYRKTLGKEIDIEFLEDKKIVKQLRKFEKYFRYIKYALALAIFIFPTLIILEPFQYMFNFTKLSMIKVTYLIIILIFCILFIRLWCRYFCPLGALLAIISKFSIFKLKLNKESCLDCEICQNICPTNAIVIKNKKRTIIFNECILCNKCRQQCGPKNITYQYFTTVKHK